MDLGMSEFNVSLGESMAWELPTWVDGEEILSFLSGKAGLAWGDLYAATPERRSLL
jgi:hypothetical protein